ncbi:MAG: SDR family oxidoreductase [Alphaproteobacteria bacterium]|nr:SDR family oxidoreductase [Alphaproteobacteria bacterium]MCB9928980.1 SDR family oxidoreductase [Alphaproteobacteria bacterium]
MRFENKIALITAAGAGIGKATTEILVREGATVIAVENQQDRLDALVASLDNQPGRVVPRCIDAMDEVQARQCVQQAIDEFGRIDILVNAVGGSTIIPKPNVDIDQMPLSDWQKILDFNLTATFLFTNAVVPHMKANKYGKIVDLASIAGRGTSFESSSPYAVAKGGIIAMVRRLSFELGPYGICINAIAPSLTLTERITPHWERRSAEDKANELKRFPLGRVAVAEDQAKVIAFLASSDADFVTGVTIDVNGGQL